LLKVALKHKKSTKTGRHDIAEILLKVALKGRHDIAEILLKVALKHKKNQSINHSKTAPFNLGNEIVRL